MIKRIFPLNTRARALVKDATRRPTQVDAVLIALLRECAVMDTEEVIVTVEATEVGDDATGMVEAGLTITVDTTADGITHEPPRRLLRSLLLSNPR